MWLSWLWEGTILEITQGWVIDGLEDKGQVSVWLVARTRWCVWVISVMTEPTLFSSWAATSWTNCKTSENQKKTKNPQSFCSCMNCHTAHTVICLCGYLRLFLLHFPKNRMKTKPFVSPAIQGRLSRFTCTIIQVEIRSNSLEMAGFDSPGLALRRLVCMCSMTIQASGVSTLLFKAT